MLMLRGPQMVSLVKVKTQLVRMLLRIVKVSMASRSKIRMDSQLECMHR